MQRHSRAGPLIPQWVDAELWNWSRWCWSGEWPHPLPPATCASAEGRYISPSDLGDEDQPPPRIRPVVERARIVQQVFDERLARLERFVLAAEYPRRNVSGRAEYGRTGAARRLRIGLAMYETSLGIAVRQVERAFEEGWCSTRRK